MTTFEKNIEALLTLNTNLATKLFAIKGHSRYEIFQGDDPVAINILDMQTNKLLYHPPAEDVLAQFLTFERKIRYPFFYMFGIGNGILVKMLLQLDSLKRIVIVEPEIEMLYIVLNIIDFSEAMEENRIQFLLADDITMPIALQTMTALEAKIYFKVYELEVPLNYYMEVFEESIKKTNDIFIDTMRNVVYTAGNDTRDTLVGLEHHIQNMPQTFAGPKYSDLLKNRNSDTAIIVSTGPSLGKQLPLLKEIAPYVTIFCIDASFPILAKHGIKPDIVLSLERDAPTSKFYTTTSKEEQEGILFILNTLVHRDTINAIKGGTKMFVARPFNYTRHFFKADNYGYAGIGMSAANLAHDIIIQMQYKNCVWIGQDLAFAEDDTSHTEGHVFGVNNVPAGGVEEDANHPIDYIEGYGGGHQVKTTQIWKLFLDFFVRNINDLVYDIKMINSTEGGARIPGTLEIPFKEVCANISQEKEKVPFSFPPTPKKEYEKEIANAKCKLKEIVTYSFTSQKRVEKLFLQIAEASEELVKLKDEDRLDEINFDELLEINTKINSIKDLVVEEKFRSIFTEVIQSTLYHQELELAKIQVKHVQTDLEKKAKLIDWIMNHREWLFVLAGNLSIFREVTKRGYKKWQEE